MSVETVSAATLAAPTLGTAPTVTATAPGPKSQPAPIPGSGIFDERDALGRLFDPLKFRPEKDAFGRWKNLRGGRPRKDGTPAGQPAPAGTPAGSFVAPDAPAPAVPSGPDKYELAADMYCRAFYATADSLFAGGGEWAPDSDAEHEQLRAAAAAYMRAKGIDDLPPGPALLLAVGTYAAKRIQRPNTNTRWRLLVNYWKARFASWRTGRKIDALPRVNTPAAP